jgi:biopolymer transport protein TolR
MAVKIPGNGGSRGTPSALCEINVTPLVDVMLVLLIIFMVTAPLLQQGIQIELPKAEGTALRPAPGQVNLVINRNQEIFLDKVRVPESELLARLQALAADRADVAVYVQADGSISYSTVARILSAVRKSKIAKVGLVTEAPDEKVKR